MKLNRSNALVYIGVTVAFMFTPFVGASEKTKRPEKIQDLLVGTKTIKSNLEHLDTALNQLLIGWETDSNLAMKRASALGLEISDKNVLVTILMESDEAADRVVEHILSSSGTVVARYKWAVDARVPVPSLSDLNHFQGLRLIHRPLPPSDRNEPIENFEKAGFYQTQGVGASNASAWHSAGMSGQGVAVAFIDSFKDWSSAQIAGELPASNLYSYGTLDASSRHGTACTEIIHDIAPSASITMASSGTYTSHAQKIVDLASLGHHVIASSQAPVEPGPGDGTGILANAISAAKNSYGSVYVQSAGNQALQHWDGYFYDGDGDYFHEISGDEINELKYPNMLSAGTSVYLLLSWADWPTTDQDFDLYLVYWNGSYWETVATSENIQSGSQPPWESIITSVPYTGYYGVIIAKYLASTNPFMDLMVHSGGISLEYQVAQRSLDDIAASPNAIAAAAIDAGSFNRESYSSQGPTYGAGGTPSGGYSQPRIAGYANVDTWSYGPGAFNGTSSASPHVAGAAALVRGAYPAYTPAQTQSFLESRALDRGASGYDYLYGYGRLWLGSPPCSYSISPSSTSVSSGGGGGSFSVTATASCPWTVSSNAAWISVTSGSSGAGNGSVSYSVSANGSASPRSGTITAAGKTFTVNQSAAPSCLYSISPTSNSLGAAGGSGSVTVTTSAGCQWSASSNDGWIIVTSGSSGSGSASVGYSVQANQSPSLRSGSVTIAGQTFTVNQSGSPTFAIFSDGFESGDTSVW